MTVRAALEGADPTDLAGLREALRVADPEGRLAPIGMSRVEIGAGALELLPEVVSELARGDRETPRVALVVDATPMRRGGNDLKAEAEGLLASRFEVWRAEIGAGRSELHADEEAQAEAAAAVEGADLVVAVGSGTITDICKAVTAVADTPLVVVQTAASVNAFSDDVSVLLKSGTKRTVPSRWPDALLVDLLTLADAPPEMNLAGFGDLICMWTAPADWYLASAVGMDDSYHEAPIALIREGGRRLLEDAARLGEREPEALERLARVLTLSGFTLGVAGKTAPLSGTEHLVSHLIDMAAEQYDLPLAFHGAQVAVASVPVAAAWEVLLAEFDPSTLDPGRLFPDEEEMEPVVWRAFAGIDPSGGVGEECWSDYRQKLALWHEARPGVERFLEEWPEHRARIKEMVLPPEVLGGALVEAGAPARFGDLEPPVRPEIARWALGNCHLMRNRFTLADLLFFAGWWDDAFVEQMLGRARSAGGGL